MRRELSSAQLILSTRGGSRTSRRQSAGDRKRVMMTRWIPERKEEEIRGTERQGRGKALEVLLHPHGDPLHRPLCRVAQRAVLLTLHQELLVEGLLNEEGSNVVQCVRKISQNPHRVLRHGRAPVRILVDAFYESDDLPGVVMEGLQLLLVRLEALEQARVGLQDAVPQVVV